LAWRAQPAERVRIAALLCFAGAILALGLAIGWGRAGMEEATSARYGTRYVTLAAPLLCWTYLVATLYPLPPLRPRLLPRALFVLMLALLVGNDRAGYAYGVAARSEYGGFAAAVAAGAPPAELAREWAKRVYYENGSPDVVAECLEIMRRTRQGPYKYVPTPASSP
jgi:hypothetical protein